jgi:hypothetical protein
MEKLGDCPQVFRGFNQTRQAPRSGIDQPRNVSPHLIEFFNGYRQAGFLERFATSAVCRWATMLLQRP